MSDEDHGDEAVDANDTQPPPKLRIPQPLLEAESADVLFDLLANERRRHLLSALEERGDERVTFEELVDAVTAAEWPEPGPATHRERVVIDLHHVHLPKLADAGLIELDPVAGTVRYDGSPMVARLLEISSDVGDANRS